MVIIANHVACDNIVICWIRKNIERADRGDLVNILWVIHIFTPVLMRLPTRIARGRKYHQPSSWSAKYDRPRVCTRFRPRVIQHPRERITTSSFSGQNFTPQWWPLVRNVGQLKLQGLGRAIQNCGAHSKRPEDQHQDSKQASCCHKREMNVCDENGLLLLPLHTRPLEVSWSVRSQGQNLQLIFFRAG